MSFRMSSQSKPVSDNRETSANTSSFKQITASRFQYIDHSRNQLGATVRLTYLADIETLIIEVVTHEPEAAHREIGQILEILFPLTPCGSTRYVDPTASEKEADSSWINLGQVQLVMLLAVSRSPKEIRIAKYFPKFWALTRAQHTTGRDGAYSCPRLDNLNPDQGQRNPPARAHEPNPEATLQKHNAPKPQNHPHHRLLRLELQPFGVEVVCVMAGTVATAFHANEPEVVLPSGSPYAAVRRFISDWATGRAGPQNGCSPDAFAKALVEEVVLAETAAAGLVWLGPNSAVVRFLARWCPAGLLDRLMMNGQGLDELTKSLEDKK
ncbi:hypothetical protein BP00DRAFT_462252 [Aspergillus indologenus CBS 114.80]|uniref:Uncharacterized protein n=1 Tax=Aspergillus indologenus CBS 114.80 TaxID=1450541 RepID=A0A2V5HTK8_9EURO|nr:hypothetical protein BP00DRAFT_462252 [Aspergillus indologenus CBS 114.80]